MHFKCYIRFVVVVLFCCVPVSAFAAFSEEGLDQNSRVMRQLAENIKAVETKIASLSGSEPSNEKFFLQLQVYGFQQHLSALNGIILEKKSKNPTFSTAKKSSEIWVINQLGVDVSTLKIEIASIESTLLSLQAQIEELAIAKKNAETQVRQIEEKIAENKQFNKAVKQQLENARLKVTALEVNIAAGNTQLKWYSLQLKNRHAALSSLKILLADSANKPLFSDRALETIYVDLKRREQDLLHEYSQVSEQMQSNLSTFLSNSDRFSSDDQDVLALRLKNSVVIAGIVSDLQLLAGLERLFWQHQYAKVNKQSAHGQLSLDLHEWLDTVNNVEQGMLEGLEWARSKKQEWLVSDSVNAHIFVELWQVRESRYSQALQDVHRVRSLLDNLNLQISNQSNDKVFYFTYEAVKKLTLNWVNTVWNFELTTVDELNTINGENITIHRSITIEKIVKALLLLMVGFFFTIKASNIIAKSLLRFTKIRSIEIVIFRKWALAFIFILLLINSLLIVHIPLSVFAFTGGAVALGLGIGMQTLLKNLVSGLMVQLERPFKPGDFIDINGIQGEVIDLGVRAAILRSPTGMETVVPNSSFMETNFTNWTLNTPFVRFELNVGVAYGSDATAVRELLMAEVLRHGLVVKDPKPDVLFSDFGSDALQFILWYWVDMREANSPKKIASDLRFMIEKSLRQNNITIAFPQRDVHLNMTGPLNVNVSHSES